MLPWQTLVITLFLVINSVVFIKSFIESHQKTNAYNPTPFLSPFGIFVWGDGLIFGPFWLAASVITLALNDWLLFLFTLSVFWLVRSFGETIYWLNEQFAHTKRNNPKNLFGYNLVKNDSIYFIYQIIYQGISVITIITSLYLGKLWLSQF